MSGNFFSPRIVILCLSMVYASHAMSAQEFEDDEMDEVTPEELSRMDIPVDERIFLETWNDVPFKTEYFTYTDEKIKQRWEQLTRSLNIPYPSPVYIRRQFERYPWLKEEISGFDGDYERLHKRYMKVGQLFLAGHFQQAREEGMELGAVGKGLAMIAQVVYAIYLEERQSVKHMLLQDVVSTAGKYLHQIEEMEGDPEVAPYAILVRLGYTYALARIAEETPIPIVVARNYAPRIKNNAEHILEVMPNHALAHAFLAGVDAGIMRKVGKFTGRITYGAKTNRVESSFSRAEEIVPDMALILYEHANALVYMSRRRELNEAMLLLEKATKIRPLFAMEALDSMYAYKRLQEVRLYAMNYRSFRKFDKERRKFAKATDRNLTSVLTPPMTKEMLSNVEAYKL